MFADLKESLRKALSFTILWISDSCWKIQNWVKDKKAVVVVGWEEGTFSEAESVLSDHWKMEKNKNNKVKHWNKQISSKRQPHPKKLLKEELGEHPLPRGRPGGESRGHYLSEGISFQQRTAAFPVKDSLPILQLFVDMKGRKVCIFEPGSPLSGTDFHPEVKDDMVRLLSEQCVPLISPVTVSQNLNLFIFLWSAFCVNPSQGVPMRNCDRGSCYL